MHHHNRSGYEQDKVWNILLGGVLSILSLISQEGPVCKDWK